MNEKKTIEQCIADLLVAKRNANRRQVYIESLEYYLRQFARKRESKPLCEFETSDVENWLSKYQSAYGRQTWMNRLSTLFSFAVRRGIIISNPCDRMERVTVDKPVPLILTPNEVERLLSACPLNVRPYLILGIFAGVRPDEIMRLDWRDIDFENKTAFVDGKTRKRRYVPLEPRAVTMLQAHPVKGGPVSPHWSTIRRWHVKARALLGLERFPQDLLRHTAASYLIALLNDTGKVAKRLGNSEKTLCSHYYAAVKEAACKAFWFPEGPKVVSMPGTVQLTPPQPVQIKHRVKPVPKGTQCLNTPIVIGPNSRHFFFPRLKALVEAGLVDPLLKGSAERSFLESEHGIAEVKAIVEQAGVPVRIAELGVMLFNENAKCPAIHDKLMLPWLN